MTHPVVKQQMLFRVPVDRVFNAFVDPAVTTKFWFTHSDGPLRTGRTVNWEWRMYGCSTQVRVLDLEPDKRIKIEWGDENGRSDVEWMFAQRPDDSTLVTITNDNFSSAAETRMAEAIDSMGGFSLVLANAKAYLEHNIDLKLIADHAPDSHVSRDVEKKIR